MIIEGFQVSGATAFLAALAPVCRALGNPNQDTRLQFGRRNWLAIAGSPDRFRALGLRVWLPPFAPAGPLQGDGIDTSADLSAREAGWFTNERTATQKSAPT